MTKQTEFRFSSEISKVDERLGLVFGWGIVCQETPDQGAYVDLQKDHIPQAGMLKAATDFQLNSRMTDDMHNGAEDGEVVFSFPLTDDIADAFGITCEKRGWMVAIKPSPVVLAKFVSGEYTGFSIGGNRVKDTPSEIYFEVAA